MNNWGSSGIYAIMILFGIILVSVVAAEVINDSGGTTIEQDISQMTDEAIDRYSTYIDINFKVGKFYQIEGVQKIKRIALQISPLFSTDIDLTELTIQLLDKDTLEILNFCGVAKYYSGGSVFENPIWNNITINNFGFLVINDRDKSIIDFNIINENSDRAYLLLELSENMALSKYNSVYVTVIPGTGISRSITLEAPMPIKPVVVFD
jgi:archaellin